MQNCSSTIKVTGDWVNKFKYMGCIIRANVTLKLVIEINCLTFLSASYAILQNCVGLYQKKFCRIINDRW